MTVVPTTLPHHRELTELVALVMESLEEKNLLTVVIVERYEHGRTLINHMHTSIQWDMEATKSKHIRLYREGIEVDNGSKIVLMDARQTERLRGMRPNKVVLFGNLGELFYLLYATQAEIKAVA